MRQTKATVKSTAKRIVHIADNLRVMANVARLEKGHDHNALFRTELVAEAIKTLAESVYHDVAVSKVVKP